MPPRNTDNTQLRIRTARLSTSPSCRRFLKEHDKLGASARVERHVDVLRMGQMMHDMDCTKELAFLDDENWQKLTPEERRDRFFEVLTIKGKASAHSGTVGKSAETPALTAVDEIAPVTRSEEPQGDSDTITPPPAEKPRTAPPVEADSEEPAQVKMSDDGATHITQKAPKKVPAIKGLGGGA